jgi:hypothetical protein
VGGGQPPFGLLGDDGPVKRVLGAALLLAAAALLGACGGDAPSSAPSSSEPSSSEHSSVGYSASASASPSPALPTATAVPAPGNRACYALDYEQAVAPTSEKKPVDCQDRHTSMTYHVGALDALVDGHLLAVDSDRVQAQVAAACPGRLAAFIGGTPEARRLSLLRSVWFTPTVEASDAGASWYRCDVIALAADEKLAALTGRLAGVLDTTEGRLRYGMCGTAEPGTPAFDRVSCSAPHSWRAITTVSFGDGAYPGLETVRAAGEQPCKDAAREIADDSLSFAFGYEWPTARQWTAGQHYGLCWAPD